MSNISKSKELVVLLFTDTLCDANGVSRFIQDIGKVANKEGKKLYIVTSTIKHHCEEREYIFNPKPLFRVKMPFYPELDLVFPSFFKLKKIAKEIDPDVVHIATPGSVGFCGFIIASLLKKPKAGVYHTDFPLYMYDNTKSKLIKKSTDLIMRLFYRGFKRVFSRSSKYVEILQNDIKISKERIVTLSAGIDTSKFDKRYKDQSSWLQYEGVRSDSIKVLYVGRVTKEKNFPLLLKIWEDFKKLDIRDVQLIVVGEGMFVETPSNFKELDIIYLGFRGGEELSKIYASSDIFIFPSTTDTLGQVVMEASSSGLPVIVSNIGGPQMVVNQNKKRSGYILDINNTDEWVERLGELSQNEPLRDELGENGKTYIHSLSIKKTFEEFWRENELISKEQNHS